MCYINITYSLFTRCNHSLLEPAECRASCKAISSVGFSTRANVEKHSNLLLLPSSLVPHLMCYSAAPFTAGTFLPLHAQQLIISIHMFWNGSLWPDGAQCAQSNLSHKIKTETHAIAHTSHCGVCKCENAATVVWKLSSLGKYGSLPQALVGIYYTGMLGLRWWNSYTLWWLFLSIKHNWL